jgi:hypothetical protein
VRGVLLSRTLVNSLPWSWRLLSLSTKKILTILKKSTGVISKSIRKEKFLENITWWPISASPGCWMLKKPPLCTSFTDSNRWRRTENDFYLFFSICWLEWIHVATGLREPALQIWDDSTRCWSDNCRVSSGKWHRISQQLPREPILTIVRRTRSKV